MYLSEYLDPYNVDHLDLYRAIHLTNRIPDKLYTDHIIPNNLAIDLMWENKFAIKMAIAWLKERPTKIEGM